MWKQTGGGYAITSVDEFCCDVNYENTKTHEKVSFLCAAVTYLKMPPKVRSLGELTKFGELKFQRKPR